MASQVDNVLLDDSTTGLPRTIDVGSDSIVLSTDLTLQAGGVFIADNVKRGTADPNSGIGTPGNEGDVYQRTLAGTGELWVNSDGTPTGWVLVTGGGSQTLAQTLIFGNTTGGTDIIITVGDEIVGQSGASLAGLVTIRGGTASSGTSSGGDVFVLGGAPLGTGSAGGDIVVSAADADSVSGPGGDITINAGDSAGAGNNGGDITIVAGSASSTGNGGIITISPGVATGSGSNGVVLINGLRHYGARATNPTSPAPAQGDRYYNTVLQMEFQYDAIRTKWLSVESVSFQVGRNFNTPGGGFYRGIDGEVLSATVGFPAFFNGTVVAFGYTRADADAATFQVTANGGTIYSLASAATTGFATNANGDFTQGQILAVRNGVGSNPTTGVQAWIKVKWRA